MSLEKSTQALVVGAGPVGMTSALLLAQQGVQATVIDEEAGPAARSYACALHPASLELFDRLGLINEILALGRRIDSVAFYEGMERRAEVNLSKLPSKFPFLLVLPQNALEELLERALKHRAGISVRWNHRLSDLQTDNRGEVARVDRLGGSAVGYIVPHWETVVKKTSEIRTDFVIGADGHNSVVRQRLGIDYEVFGDPELFAVFEFEADAQLPSEVRVVLEASTTNVLWPLPGGRYRWSFQLVRKELHEEFPDKERRAFWVDDPEKNQQLQQRLRHLLEVRAPWFTAEVRQFDWISHVQFEHLLVKHFGRDSCWLVGDAAHQTGPAGVQSLNVGLREADELAVTVKARLNGDNVTGDIDAWQKHWRAEWESLLGLKGPLKASDQTDAWVQQRAAKILPCLPASGGDLARCVKQLRLEFPEATS